MKNVIEHIVYTPPFSMASYSLEKLSCVVLCRELHSDLAFDYLGYLG